MSLGEHPGCAAVSQGSAVPTMVFVTALDLGSVALTLEGSGLALSSELFPFPVMP